MELASKERELEGEVLAKQTAASIIEDAMDHVMMTIILIHNMCKIQRHQGHFAKIVRTGEGCLEWIGR